MKVGNEFLISHLLRQSYFEGRADKGLLPALPGLNVLDGIKCPECPILYVVESTLRNLLRDVHKIGLSPRNYSYGSDTPASHSQENLEIRIYSS